MLAAFYIILLLLKALSYIPNPLPPFYGDRGSVVQTSLGSSASASQIAGVAGLSAWAQFNSCLRLLPSFGTVSVWLRVA